MSARRNLRFAFLKWYPRKRKLKGSFLHKIIGDRLFDHKLWKLEAHGTAAGFALGTFIAFTPTFPLQMLIAAVLAIFFRVNVPAALMACWITNPLTMPIIFPLEYKLGVWINNVFSLPDMADFHEPLKQTENLSQILGQMNTKSFFGITMKNVKAMVIGSLLTSTVFSLLTYGVFYFLLDKLLLRKKNINPLNEN